MTGNKEAGLFDTTKPAASEKLLQQQRDSQRDNTKSRQEQEEKLIMTAWKNMQHSLCEDSRAAGLPQSFLAQQRRSTQARRALSPRLEPR
ncbi:protein Hook homolog 3-like [Embiotoca jacksoni]|uniref:protein Hook homolog 3-like n=1 Tax=Embiotoca jacksoni TaxID=100190 RepID=UPI0037049E76